MRILNIHARLHKKSYVTKYTAYTQKFDSDNWVQLKQYLVDRDDDLIIKFIMFANTAVLCLITTRYLQHVYLMAYMLKKFQKSYHS